MSDDITEALKKARYNEIVQVNVSDGENSRELILGACLDEENGGVQWSDLSENGSSTNSLTKRHLRTKQWFFPMLNDSRRNELYQKAIQLASDEVIQRFPNERLVTNLDIGGGTGLLAMISARSLDKASKVSSLVPDNTKVQIKSLEMSTAMAKIATLTVASNELDDTIQVLEQHSCEMESLEPKAHLCTSELLESGLLAEGWLPAMRDAWERHLDPNAVVVPQRARIVCQVIQGECLSNYWGPHQDVSGFPESRRLKLYERSLQSDTFLLGGTQGTQNGVQIPVHAEQLFTDKRYQVTPLSDPISILDFSVTSKDSIPPPEGRSRTIEFIPTRSGTAHAILFWWELDLYGETLTYTTRHDKGPWQDHWHQCIFVFSRPKTECIELSQDQPAILRANHDDSRVYFDITLCQKENSNKRFKPTNHTERQALITPERAWQLNDVKRAEILRNGLQFALQKQGLHDAVVLDLSDFSLCAMMAALLGAPNVSSIESSLGSLPMMTARIAQLSNNLPLKEKSFQILQCHPEQLTIDFLGGKAPNIVAAEPYYEILERWHLQEALNYFYTLRALKRGGILSNVMVSIPRSACVKVCAFESYDIGNAYKPCESSLCGFQHGVANSNAALHDHDISLQSWQYEMIQLTDPIKLATIDYEACEIKANDTLVRAPFRRAGTCHGVLIWIEYEVTIGKDQHSILTTNDRSHHQIIRMLPSPIKVLQKETTFLSCKCKLGNLSETKESHELEFEIQV